MGCDIHGEFQTYNQDLKSWIGVPTNYEFNRHYVLFAMLADVRNEWNIEPISLPRGIPPDIDINDHDPAFYHSHSWLLGTKILAYEERNKNSSIQKSGIIDRDAYSKWDGVSAPYSYSGGVFGHGILVVNDSISEMTQNSDWTHVKVRWKENFIEETSYFFDEVRRLEEIYGSIRFIFRFDS